MVITRLVKHHSLENHGRREKTELNMDVILHITNGIHSFIVLVTNYPYKTGCCRCKRNINILPCKHLFQEQLYVYFFFYNVGTLPYSTWLHIIGCRYMTNPRKRKENY